MVVRRTMIATIMNPSPGPNRRGIHKEAGVTATETVTSTICWGSVFLAMIGGLLFVGRHHFRDDWVC